MKLSEAIRLGAMLKPQGFGILRARGRTCALGAAYEAAGLPWDNDSMEAASAYAAFPLMLAKPVACPECGDMPFDYKADFAPDEFSDVVAHLNDRHRWSREQIADWLEGIERAQEAERVSQEASSMAAVATPVACPVPLSAR